MLKLGVLLILFDVYLKYAQLERLKILPISHSDPPSAVLQDFNEKILLTQIMQHPVYGYLHVLVLCLLEFFIVHLVIRLMVFITVAKPIVKYNYLSTALIISSFAKLLLILMVIWDFDLEYSWLVGIIVLSSNAEALSGTCLHSSL